MAENTQESQQVEQAEETHVEEAVDWEAKYKEAVEQSRKWEGRAKANKDKAAKWDEYEQQGMSEQEKLAKRAETAEAELAQIKAEQERQALVAKAAKDAGVDAELLAAMSGTTEEQVKANAKLLKTKFAQLPAYPTRTDDGGGSARPAKREIPQIF